MPVEIEVQGRDASYIKPVKVQAADTGGLFAVQVGSFTESINAVRLKVALRLTYASAYVQETLINGTVYYRVRVGNFDQITRITSYNVCYTKLLRIKFKTEDQADA